ncbi:MAG: CHAT domain-containing protein [Egibacteraceae bacterium]
MDLLIARFLQRHRDEEPELADGLTAMVAGDVVTAAERLAAVGDGVEDPAVRVRAAAYHRLATHLRWNVFPGGGGAGATEVAVRWDGAPSAVDAREDWAAVVRRLDDPRLAAEVRAVGGGLCALGSVRAIVGHTAARLAPAEVDARLEEALRAVVPLGEAGGAGDVALASADLARRARRPERAAAFLQAAARAYGTAGDRGGLGACHLLRGDWRAAPAAGPETRNLTLVASAAESSALDWALESAEASRTGLDVEGAAAAYAEAEEAFAAADAPRGLSAVTLRRGHLAALAGDHDRAGELAGRAAAAADACGDRWGAWLARTHAALDAVAAGRLAEGDERARQVGAWGAGTGSFSYALGLGLLCSRAGRHWLHRRTDPERALACHRLARTIFATLGAVTDEAQSLADRGRALHVVGDLAGAATADEEALHLLATDLEARPAAAADNRLRAVALAQRLYLLHQTRRDPTAMASAAERLRAMAARLPAAPDDRVEGLLAHAAEAALVEAPVLVPLYRGDAARAAGDQEAAASHYGAALEAVHASDHPDAEHLEAVVLGHWRRYPEAAAAYQRHLDAASAPAGLLGRVLSRFGPLRAEVEAGTRRLHEQAGAFFRRLRDPEAAVAHFAALDRVDARWWDGAPRPWELLADYGVACEGLGELDRALALHDEAIVTLEGSGPTWPDERDDDPTDAPAVYLGAARTAVRLGEAAAGTDAERWLARAFAYAERGRARSTADLLTRGLGLAEAPPGSSPAVAGWHAAVAERWVRAGLVGAERVSAHPDPDRLAALREEIAVLDQRLTDLQAALAQAAPEAAAVLTTAAEPPGLDAVRAALPPGAVLLAYHQVDQELLAFAVTAEGIAAHRASVDGVELARHARVFAAACVDGADVTDAGAPLTRALLDPHAGTLERADRVLVAPAPVLRTVAFAALPWHDGPLGASHTVAYLPGAAAPAGTAVTPGTDAAAAPAGTADPSGPGRHLAVGDPAAPAWQARPGGAPGPAPRRPASATEAAVVAAALGDTRLLVGDAATRSAVTAAIGTAPLVHLATATQVRDDAPLLSAILCANGEAVSIYELIVGRLHADRVVVSACHPAGAGSEALAVASGLLGAGARGAVVTLWPADDRTTCVLMARFSRLLRGGTSGPIALQAAQTHLRAMSDSDEAAEFAALQAAAADPAVAADQLAPLSPPTGQRLTGQGPTGHVRPARVWAGYCYVGR